MGNAVSDNDPLTKIMAIKAAQDKDSADAVVAKQRADRVAKHEKMYPRNHAGNPQPASASSTDSVPASVHRTSVPPGMHCPACPICPSTAPAVGPESVEDAKQ